MPDLSLSMNPRSSAGNSAFDLVRAFRVPSVSVLKDILKKPDRPQEEKRSDGYWHRDVKDPSSDKRPWAWGDAAAGAQLRVNADSRVLTLVTNEDRDMPVRRVRVSGRDGVEGELRITKSDETGLLLWGNLIIKGRSAEIDMGFRAFPETSPDVMRKCLALEGSIPTNVEGIFAKRFFE